MGGVDLRRDLGAGDGNLQMLYARSHIVVASRAAGLGPPIDSVYPRLDDDPGLRQHAEFARSLGFFGKSAIHPRQLGTIHDVFTPSEQELTWVQARPYRGGAGDHLGRGRSQGRHGGRVPVRAG